MAKNFAPFSLFFPLLFFPLLLPAQKHDNVWLMGVGTPYNEILGTKNSRLDFSHWPPLLTEAPKLPFQLDRSSTTVSDAAGNLLFYTNAHLVGDAGHGVMENGDSLNFYYPQGLPHRGNGTIRGAVALPSPASGDEYFLLHLNTVGHGYLDSLKATHLLCTRVDMGANGGIGAVTSKNETVLEGNLMATGLTAVRHANGRDWWVLVFAEHSDEYHRVLLTPDGPLSAGTGKVDVPIIPYLNWTVFSPDGARFAVLPAVPSYPGLKPWAEVFDFDRCTGELSNRKRVRYGAVPDISNVGQSVCFSPNSRYLYIFRDWEVFQADVTAPDPQATLVKTTDYDGFVSHYPTAFSGSQLGPDGRIYVNDWAPKNDYLHILENPNGRGRGCALVQHALRLKGLHGWALPAHPNYRLGPLEGSGCDTLGVVRPVSVAAHPYPFEACAGGEGHFEATAFGTGLSYRWQSSPDGGATWHEVQAGPHFSGEAAPVLRLHDIPAGLEGHLFRCAVTGEAGAETTRHAALTLAGVPPQAAFTYFQDRDSVHFEELTPGLSFSTWVWDNGDTTVGAASPSRLYLHQGIYPVVLVSRNACGTDTARAEVVIGPIMAHLAGSPLTGCAPLEVAYSAAGSSHRAASRDGRFPGGSPAQMWFIGANPGKVVYGQPGTYDAELRVHRGLTEFDTVRLTSLVTVLEGTNPVADIGVQQSGGTVALSTSFSLGDSYTWSLGNGDTLSGQSATYTFGQPGLYQVVLQTTNHCGTATGAQAVVVGELRAAFTVVEEGACAPVTVRYENTTGFHGASFEWHFPGGEPAFSLEENPVVQYASPGVYPAMLVARAGALADTLLLEGAVEALGDPCPSPYLAAEPEGLVLTAWTGCQATDQLTWHFGDGTALTGAQAVTHQYASAGTYTVTLVSAGPCGSDTLSVEVTVSGPSALGGAHTGGSVVLVPNPARGTVSALSPGGMEGGGVLRLFDALGREVLREGRSPWGARELFRLEGLAPGAYHYRVEAGDGSVGQGRIVVAGM